jgi:hypothetical protein
MDTVDIVICVGRQEALEYTADSLDLLISTGCSSLALKTRY